MTLYAFEGRVPEIAATAYVAPSAQVIGRVVVGRECWIGHGAILRGDYGTILVGDQTAVEDGVIVHARPDDTTRLGRRVTLGHGCMVHNATIRDGATIGMRATVSDFSVVGEGAVVGEMCLVKQHQEIPPGAVAVGVPARVVGDVSDKHRDMTVWAKDVYVDLARRYPGGLSAIPGAAAGAFAFRPIGVIRTPFAEPGDAPRQGALAPQANGTIELDPHYAAGLDGLEGKSHVALLWVFHRSEGYDLRVTPHGRDRERGLFSTRAPCRPNPIGLTVVKLERVEDTRLHVLGVDMVDGTPLLDIKPSNPELDAPGAPA
jgi:tRNA-Thr(GGU) m(6)t(6)A37 methyltransferase TsaA